MHATIREEISSGRVSSSRRVPEHIRNAWVVALLGTDVLASLSACYMAGLPAGAGPAACVLLCGAVALCGVYQSSYAVRWYDEIYAVITAMGAAFVPLLVLLNKIAGFTVAQTIVAVVLTALLMSILHCTLHLARHGMADTPEATAAYVSPEAQWKARHGFYPVWKRCFDIVFALLILTIASPFMLLAAVCIGIESGFPIFFRQERVGRNGTRFVMYKFRTMWQDAGGEWVRPGDSRVTNIGSLLRASSIDELPQLFNVIVGQMSLVGPRPEMPEFAREFRRNIPKYEDRHIVTPGLTGWAQLYCKRNLQPKDMPAIIPYDLFYVEHASPSLDAILVVKTAVELFVHRGV